MDFKIFGKIYLLMTNVDISSWKEILQPVFHRKDGLEGRLCFIISALAVFHRKGGLEDICKSNKEAIYFPPQWWLRIA